MVTVRSVRITKDGEIIVRLSKQSPDNVTLQNDLIWFNRQIGGQAK